MVPREAARLLCVGRSLRDRRISDLPDHLDARDLLVLNDTKVIPARLSGRRGEAAVEVTLLEPLEDRAWTALARPARKLKAGDAVVVADDLELQVIANRGGGAIEVRLVSDMPWLAALERHGAMPLPPYIRRERGGDPADRDDYQSLFAEKPGAVAAPTASLHLTRALMDRLAGRGVATVTVTLHVGAGTFLPVKADDTEAHRMHFERFSLSKAAAQRLNAHRAAGGRVVAVGTTALRTLESCCDGGGVLHAREGRTDLFLTPGSPIRSADKLLTNFHLPSSTLLMLVSAFSGIQRIRHAYRHAIRCGYRFFSYGDACLLERAAR